MFRNGRSQQRIRHIGRGPVIGPIRRLLQAHAGANRLKPAHVVRNRQRPQGDPVRAGGAPRPLRPPSQEIIPDTVLRHLDRDGAVCRLQAIDDHIALDEFRRETTDGKTQISEAQRTFFTMAL